MKLQDTDYFNSYHYEAYINPVNANFTQQDVIVTGARVWWRVTCKYYCTTSMWGIDLGWTDIYTTIRREFTTVAEDQLFGHLCNTYARYFERWNPNGWLWL